jgi:hypothetical protein
MLIAAHHTGSSVQQLDQPGEQLQDKEENLPPSGPAHAAPRAQGYGIVVK